MPSEFEHINDGLVVVLDIVDFSVQPPNVQRDWVNKLWVGIDRWHTKEGTNGSIHLNCTGDGALIAVDTRTSSVKEEGLLEFVHAITDQLRAATPSAGLRIGVHRGEFSLVTLPGFDGRRQCIGSAPNKCERVCSIGDAGDIVVSLEFVSAWAKRDPGAIALFHPRDAKPLDVLVKHSEIVQVLLYSHPGTKAQATPRKAADLQTTQRSIRNVLLEINHRFVELVRFGYEDQGKRPPTPEQVSCRVSLFMPDIRSDLQQLALMDRVCDVDGSSEKKGTTFYSISGKGEGPVGKAFCTYQPQVLHNLPHFNSTDSRKAYKKQMETFALTDTAKIENFQRKARAFVAFPVGLEVERPDAAICIDCMSSLNALTRDQLQVIAVHLTAAYNHSVAALVRLRLG